MPSTRRVPHSRLRTRALACAVIAGGTPALGQSEVPIDFKNLNAFGTGVGSLADQTISSLRMPFGFWAVPLEERSWGLRFRIPVTFGIADFDLGNGTTLDDVKALVVLPTVEVHIPLDDSWTLKPFVGLGGGWEFESDKRSWIGTAGLVAERERPFTTWTANYGAGLRYDWTADSDGAAFDDFGRFEFKLEMRRAIGASARGHHLEPGAYGMAFLYWDDLSVDVGGPEKLEVWSEYELGMSVGALPRVAVLGLDLPRVFVGWRFGQNLQGIRITFGSLF